MRNWMFIALTLPLGGNAWAAEAPLPPLTPATLSPLTRNFCMSEDMVMELLKNEPHIAAVAESADNLQTIELLQKAADDGLRQAAERMLAAALNGDAGNRGTVSRTLASCLVAGAPMTPQRREQGLAWLREDANSGTDAGLRQLMTLALLKEVEGGGKIAFEQLGKLSNKAPDTTTPEGLGVALFQMQKIAAEEVMQAVIQSFDPGAPKPSAGSPRPTATYRFCNNTYEVADDQPDRVRKLVVRANARLQQLPQPLWNCNTPEFKDLTFRLQWGTEIPAPTAQ